MSSTDPMRDDSLIPSEIMRKTLLRPYRLRQILNTKSLSLTKLTTHPMMYNSYYGRLLRSSLAIADSSSPATTKTKSSNPYILGVPSSNSELREKKDRVLQHSSSNVSNKSWMQKVLNMITRSW